MIRGKPTKKRQNAIEAEGESGRGSIREHAEQRSKTASVEAHAGIGSHTQFRARI